MFIHKNDKLKYFFSLIGKLNCTSFIITCVFSWRRAGAYFKNEMPPDGKQVPVEFSRPTMHSNIIESIAKMAFHLLKFPSSWKNLRSAYLPSFNIIRVLLSS